MSFPTVAGTVWGLVVLGITAWVGHRHVRGGGGRRVWVVLAAAVATVPWGPASHVTLRLERALFSGPDLFSPEPERWVVVQDSSRAGGLARVRRARRVQGETLLSEVRRVQLRVPWLWLAVVSGVGFATARRRWSSPFWTQALVSLGVGLVLLAGCTDDTAPGPAEARLLEVLEMRRTGSVEGIEGVFLPEAVYEDVPGDFEYRGVPEIAAYLGGLHDWATGVFLDVVRIRAGRESASAEWYLEGIQSGPVPGRLDTVTGRRFRLRGLTLVELERGAVVRAVDYLDWVPFLLDVGAEIHWPGGGVTTGGGGTDGGGAASAAGVEPVGG